MQQGLDLELLLAGEAELRGHSFEERMLSGRQAGAGLLR